MPGINFEDLEAYLFAENKQEFINRLASNTEPHSFFSLLYSLQNSTTVSSEVQAQIDEYHESFKTTSSQNIYIRGLLKRFDDPSTPQETKTNTINQLISQFSLGLQFNYSKPSNIQSTALNQNQERLPSVLDPKSICFDPKAPEYYTDPWKFQTILPEALSKIDASKMLQSDERILERFIRDANPIDHAKFPDLILKLMDTRPYVIDYNSLPLDQLQRLKKDRPNLSSDSQFVSILFKKEFGGGSFDTLIQGMSRKERRDLASKVYSWSKGYLFFEGLISRSLYEILQLDLEQNKFDKNLFIEYLKDPMDIYSKAAQEYQKVLRKKIKSSSPISFGVIRIEPDLLIPSYLEEFFKDTKSVSPFDQYLDSKYLTELFYSTKLVLGQSLANKALTPEATKALIDSKELKICRYNRDYFKKDEPVALILTLKNVPSLMVKVFLRFFHTITII